METPSPKAPGVRGWGQVGDGAGLGPACWGPQLPLHSCLSLLPCKWGTDPTPQVWESPVS